MLIAHPFANFHPRAKAPGRIYSPLSLTPSSAPPQSSHHISPKGSSVHHERNDGDAQGPSSRSTVSVRLADRHPLTHFKPHSLRTTLGRFGRRVCSLEINEDDELLEWITLDTRVDFIFPQPPTYSLDAVRRYSSSSSERFQNWKTSSSTNSRR